MKTLLLHVPKFNNFYKPIGDFIWLNYMPMGLLAIADHAVQNGMDVEVVHAVLLYCAYLYTHRHTHSRSF